jgi:hypothetical protein
VKFKSAKAGALRHCMRLVGLKSTPPENHQDLVLLAMVHCKYTYPMTLAKIQKEQPSIVVCL